jgi:hypothetical protein
LKELFSDYVLQKDKLFIYLDSADDFDSYMIKMEDVIDTFSLEDANSVFDDSVKNDFSVEKFNFSEKFLSIVKYDLDYLVYAGYSVEDLPSLITLTSFDSYKNLFLGDLFCFSKSLSKQAFRTIIFDTFENNCYFSLSTFFDEFSEVEENVTNDLFMISGLNSFFESNNIFYDYYTSG